MPSANSDLIARASLDLILGQIVRHPFSSSAFDVLGNSIGFRYAERITLKRIRFTNQLEVFKFLCKEIWNVFFDKNADKLRTNNAGIYVIQDDDVRWLRYLSSTDEDLVQKLAQHYSWVMSGVVRGSLKALGVDAVVKGEVGIYLNSYSILIAQILRDVLIFDLMLGPFDHYMRIIFP